MDAGRVARGVVTVLAVVALCACTTLPGRDPVQVNVVGIDSLPGEGAELRMLVRLRVQNPNDAVLDYDGVYVKLDVLDGNFATGVSDARGSVPRFGEAVIGVPVSVSMLRVAFNALRVLNGKPVDKVRYRLEGKLHGPALGSTSFEAQGELTLPE